MDDCESLYMVARRMDIIPHIVPESILSSDYWTPLSTLLSSQTEWRDKQQSHRCCPCLLYHPLRVLSSSQSLKLNLLVDSRVAISVEFVTSEISIFLPSLHRIQFVSLSSFMLRVMTDIETIKVDPLKIAIETEYNIPFSLLVCPTG